MCTADEVVITLHKSHCFESWPIVGTGFHCVYTSNSSDHDFIWNSLIADYGSYIKGQELSQENFNNHVPASREKIMQIFIEYVNSLSILKNYQPWALEFASDGKKLSSNSDGNCHESVTKIENFLSRVSEGRFESDEISPLQVLSSDNIDSSCSYLASERESSSTKQWVSISSNLAPEKEDSSAKQMVSINSNLALEKEGSSARHMISGSSNSSLEKESFYDKPVASGTGNSNIVLEKVGPSVEHMAYSSNLDHNKKVSSPKLMVSCSIADEFSCVEERDMKIISGHTSNGDVIQKKDGPALRHESACHEGRSLILSDYEVDYHTLDDPVEELLSGCNIENLDQSVEYVTVDDTSSDQDAAQELEIIHSSDEKNIPNRNQNIKRKSSEHMCRGVSKLCKKSSELYSEKDLLDFKLCEGIENENYLILHFPTQGCPSECPNCYCELCLSMLTINCSTYVSKIVCTDCKLTLYILPD
ncbi:hypothetical protein SK128_020060 [Halocaridina rubra]|uniref:Uncharacterized protein n=1 Tax=Halocaridina rubra TaxID=373956 RepID=A0AAN8X353_HALRR